MRWLLVVLMLLAAPAAAQEEEWDLRAVVAIDLVGVNWTTNKMGFELAPVVGVAYTDGQHFVLGGLSFGTSSKGRYFMPTIGVGSKFQEQNYTGFTLVTGYRFVEQEGDGTPWLKEWISAVGTGTPIIQTTPQ